jgi:uncharacterized delta-60 repeat protein
MDATPNQPDAPTEFSKVRRRVASIALPLIVAVCCACSTIEMDYPIVLEVGATTAKIEIRVKSISNNVTKLEYLTAIVREVGGEKGKEFHKFTDTAPATIEVDGLKPDTDYVVSSGGSSGAGTVIKGGDRTAKFRTLSGPAIPDQITTRDVLGDAIYATAALPDGKSLVGGKFSLVGGKVHTNLVRLNPGGAVDSAYGAVVSGGWVASLAVQTDGKVLVGGHFDQVNGLAGSPNLARLDAVGRRDGTFLGTVGTGSVESLAIQTDGKILVGGNFQTLRGDARYGTLGRLNASGTLDTTFNPGTAVGADGTVRSIVVQADGKILIAGDFSNYNGTARAGFARLEANGTLDTAFNPGVKPDSIALLPGGEMLVAAAFPLNTPPGYGIARYLANGTRDPLYAAADPDHVVRLNGPAHSLAVRADGSVLVGGPTLINGVATKGVARLDAAGTLDPTFLPKFEYLVSALGMQADGDLIIGGDEFALAGEKQLIAVTQGASTTSLAAETLPSQTLPSRVEWLRGGDAPELSQVTFELSTNGGAAWTPLGSGSRISGGWEKTGLTLPASGMLRARGRTTEGGSNASSGVVEQIESFPTAGADNVTVIAPTSSTITASSAVLGGNVTSGGSSAITARGVVYSPTSVDGNPFLGSTFARNAVATGTTTGVFTVPVTDLIEGAHYTFKAYATNGSGTRYSPIGTFVTKGAPVVNGATSTGITNTEATLGGTVVDDGGFPILQRGILLIPLAAQTTNRLATQSNASRRITAEGTTGDLSVFVTGLNPGSEYRISAYAINHAGTTYSETREFTTTGVAPSEPEESTTESGAGDESSGGGAAFSSVAEAPIDGAGDETFDAGEIGGIVQAIAVLPDGELLIGGEFITMGGETRGGLARLDADGNLDLSFDPSMRGWVYSLLVQPDGQILVGGAFVSVNGAARPSIARLDPDGDLESATTFDVAGGVDGVVYTMALQDDGKILIGGLFQAVQGVERSNLARLDADGTLDEDFDPSANDAVYSLAVQSDGKILVAGYFDEVNETAANHIARLESDGDIDPAFVPGSAANDRITGLALQPDGTILICGDFTQYNGTLRNRITRLRADGTLDGTFNAAAAAGANDTVYTMALQTDGKILLGGIFTSVNSTARNGIARLLANGAIDTSFDPGDGADGEVSAIALQEDGGILVGGDFENIDNVSSERLARFENAAATETFTVVNGLSVEWLRGGSGPEVQDAALEFSDNGGLSWAERGIATRIAGGWRFEGDKLPLSGMVRARGNTAGGFLSGSAGLVEAIADFDHTTTIASLRAQATALQANLTKLQKQIKSAKKKKNQAKVKKLTKQLKTETTRLTQAQTDLGKY